MLNCAICLCNQRRYMKDKRRFIRFNAPLRVEFSLEGRINVPRRGETIDFSREGMKVFIPSFNFSHKNTTDLKLYLPNRLAPVSVKGAIKWVKSRDSGWELGMKIAKIDSREKSEILDYVYKCWVDKNNDKKW